MECLIAFIMWNMEIHNKPSMPVPSQCVIAQSVIEDMADLIGVYILRALFK